MSSGEQGGGGAKLAATALQAGSGLSRRGDQSGFSRCAESETNRGRET